MAITGPVNVDMRRVKQRKDEISGNPVRLGCYTACSALNRKHAVFAWLSLFSVGFAEAGTGNELADARHVAGHFGTDHHEHYITAQDVVEAVPLIAMAHDQPFGNSSAVPAYYCAKLAKEGGVQTMLGGDGGEVSALGRAHGVDPPRWVRLLATTPVPGPCFPTGLRR